MTTGRNAIGRTARLIVGHYGQRENSPQAKASAQRARAFASIATDGLAAITETSIPGILIEHLKRQGYIRESARTQYVLTPSGVALVHAVRLRIEAIERYERLESMYSIAGELGVAFGSVRNWLRDAGVTIRPSSLHATT